MKFNITDKLTSNKKNGIIFWFTFPIFILIVFYQPFNQPILFDRAYLLYVSQVVYRGELLYRNTTFGYTPFSTLLVGLIMKIGSVFSLTTIESARIFGIFFYGCICSSFYLLAKSLWSKSTSIITACIMFTGLDYIAILSGVNAEPKMWVLFFTILGILFLNKKNWLLSSIFFSMAAMCWHVAVISVLALGLTLLILKRDFWLRLNKVILGILLGISPVVIYLAFTNQWIDFWEQAILRKINVEGNQLGESPFIWFSKSIYPAFTTEIFHFIFGIIGFILLINFIIKKQKILKNIISNQTTSIFIIVYSLMWGCFNSIEFQSNVDFFTLVPIITILSTYFLIFIYKIDFRFKNTLFFIILIIYNYFNAFIYKLPYSFKQQYKTYYDLDKRFGNAITINFMDYYAVLEKSTPTKYLQLAPYEEIILKDKISCDSLLKSLKKKKITYAIERVPSKKIRSDAANKLFKLFRINPKSEFKRIECIDKIIDTSNPKNIKLIETMIETIYFNGKFYNHEPLMIYPINFTYSPLSHPED